MLIYNQNYLPLLTFSFLDFFLKQKLDDKILVEIGSGESTLFWPKIFKEVITYENDIQYYARYKNKLVNNNKIFLFNNTIFVDESFKEHIKKADYVIIDNDPSFIDRHFFCKYVVQNKKDSCCIILDNGPWNLKAYQYLNERFFCKDFPGKNRENEMTVTSLYETKRNDIYYFANWRQKIVF